ncbi:MAG: CBS domain-containing protein, partial [Planctomycetales bacterium]|nr:CBS domain-containing protein [Planctomycetales bacterium]
TIPSWRYLDSSMIVCPFCDALNIEGADVCEECGQTLADLHLPTPATDLERDLLRDRVSTVEPKEAVVVAPTATVGEVLETLVKEETGCALVVDNGKLVGIFSAYDALMRVNADLEEFASHPISDVMTKDPHHIAANAKLAFAVRMMDLGGYRHAPVLDGDAQLVGVISARDILRYLHNHMTS